MHILCILLFALSDFSFVYVPSVLWYCWLGLLTCKNRPPYNLYCVGGDLKQCSIQSETKPIWIRQTGTGPALTIASGRHCTPSARRLSLVMYRGDKTAPVHWPRRAAIHSVRPSVRLRFSRHQHDDGLLIPAAGSAPSPISIAINGPCIRRHHHRLLPPRHVTQATAGRVGDIPPQLRADLVLKIE